MAILEAFYQSGADVFYSFQNAFILQDFLLCLNAGLDSLID
jgi:hypothetical protein